MVFGVIYSLKIYCLTIASYRWYITFGFRFMFGTQRLWISNHMQVFSQKTFVLMKYDVKSETRFNHEVQALMVTGTLELAILQSTRRSYWFDVQCFRYTRFRRCCYNLCHFFGAWKKREEIPKLVTRGLPHLILSFAPHLARWPSKFTLVTCLLSLAGFLNCRFMS